MRKEDLFIKNHVLGVEFDRYILENPGMLEQMSDNAEIFFLPKMIPSYQGKTYDWLKNTIQRESRSSL